MNASRKYPSGLTRRIHRGFTLIELLLVMVIIAVLAGIVLPRLTGKREQANQTKAVAEINTFKTCITNFDSETGKLPTSLQDLVTNPGVTGWNGPYLQSDKVPKDPWGRDYVYQCPGTNGRDYDLYSTGTDGQSRVGE